MQNAAIASSELELRFLDAGVSGLAQFEQNRCHYANKLKTAAMDFADVKFKASFRSAPLVLEAVDEASAILDFVRANGVDHLLVGARQHTLMRALLGSVSARVSGEAPCTVTVVRPARADLVAAAAREHDTRQEPAA